MNTGSTRVFYLSYGDAPSIAEVLNGILSSQAEGERHVHVVAAEHQIAFPGAQNVIPAVLLCKSWVGEAEGQYCDVQ